MGDTNKPSIKPSGGKPKRPLATVDGQTAVRGGRFDSSGNYVSNFRGVRVGPPIAIGGKPYHSGSGGSPTSIRTLPVSSPHSAPAPADATSRYSNEYVRDSILGECCNQGHLSFGKHFKLVSNSGLINKID